MVNCSGRKLNIIHFIISIVIGYILFVPTSVFANEKVNVYLFYGDGCSYCEKAFEGFESIKDKYGDKFQLIKYEIWNNEKNADLSEEVAKTLGNKIEGVPYIVIGSQSWNGYHEDYISQITSKIDLEYEKSSSERFDVIDLINNSAKKSTTPKETLKNKTDNLSVLLTIIVIGILVMVIVLVPMYQKMKNNKKTKSKFIKITLGLSGGLVVVVVLALIVTNNKDLKGTKQKEFIGELYKYNIEELDYSMFKTKFYEIHYRGGTGDSSFKGEGHYILKNDGTCFTSQKKSLGLYGLDYTTLNSTQCNYVIKDTSFNVNMKIHSITHYNGFDDSKDEEINVTGTFSENFKYLQIGNLKYSSEHYNTYLEENMEYVLINPITTQDYTLDGISLGNSENSIDVSKYKIIDK